MGPDLGVYERRKRKEVVFPLLQLQPLVPSLSTGPGPKVQRTHHAVEARIPYSALCPDFPQPARVWTPRGG